jgi:hypothetical protein
VFRYPNDYPITFRSGDDLVKQYFFDDKYIEWVNFSSEFYPNAGGDRLGDIIIYKNTQYKDIQDYVNKELGSYVIPPKSSYLKIAGEEALCPSLEQQPHSFTPPSDKCIFIHKGELYRISFNFNSYYHKLPSDHYAKGKEIILSTFKLNK